MRKAVALVLVAFLASACRPDTLQLQYRFPEGGEITYRMDARASARWNIGNEGAGSYHVVFEVTETVEPDDEGEGTLVSVVMTPSTVEEDGLPSPGAQERSFRLRLGVNGEVLEVLEVDGVEANALDPDELAFIGTYRPPLPLVPVTLGDEWRAEQEVNVGTVFQQVQSVGALEALDKDGEGRTAGLSYEGSGPLVWTTELPQGQADLTGSATTTGTALLDIDEGSLRRAGSSTRGSFEVRVDPAGERAPVTGTLELDLDLRLERL